MADLYLIALEKLPKNVNLFGLRNRSGDCRVLESPTWEKMARSCEMEEYVANTKNPWWAMKVSLFGVLRCA